MPLTAKEKMLRYRERLKNDNPEKYEEQRKKNLARIKSKKKKISEMAPAEAEAQRKEWREEKRVSRQRRHDMSRELPMHENMCSTAENNVKSGKTEVSKIKKLQLKLKLALKQNKNCKAQIEKLKTKVERYKKRIQRVQSLASTSIANLEKSLDNVKARNEVLESALKTSFSGCTKHSEKQLIKKVVHNSKNKQYTSKVLGLKVTARQKPKKARKIEIPEITSFYVRDDVSRITSGKKECRVKNKRKMQIRYLVDSILNLHKKYRAEGGRYGITTFYEKKPFFVLSPHVQSRSTCLCEKHDNIKFQYETLKRNQIVTNENFDKLLQELVCDTKKIECMYNTCNECKNKKPKYVADQDIFEKTVNWYRWERQAHVYTKKGGTTVQTKKTVRAMKTDTAQKLMQDFNRDIIAFKKHHFNNIHQQKVYQKAVSNMKVTEAVIVCDFSENYECKLTEEIQSMHFGASKSQISLHTGMIYLKSGSQSFCTISDNLNHQPPAIWAHLTPILATVKEKCPDLNVIHYYSDGPSSQYRQKHNFFLHSLFTKELNLFYSTWSYFEAGHGKSVADGIGGTIKRMLDFKVCHGTDVKNARDAYEAIKQTETVIQVHLIEEKAVREISNRIPGDIPVLPGTMKIHQIIASDGVKIKYRDVSCFCEPLRGTCCCFSPGQHTLLSSNTNYNYQNNVVSFPENKTLMKPKTTGNDKIEVDLSVCEVNTELVVSSHADLDEVALRDLVELENPIPPITRLADLSRTEMEETTLFDAVDMEGINDFVGCSTSMIDSNLDINIMPLFFLPETLPSSISKKDNLLTQKSCLSKKLTKTTTIQPTKKEINFQKCNSCSCSILGQMTKCMACKQFYCEDCVGGPSFLDYLCDICLQASDED